MICRCFCRRRSHTRDWPGQAFCKNGIKRKNEYKPEQHHATTASDRLHDKNPEQIAHPNSIIGGPELPTEVQHGFCVYKKEYASTARCYCKQAIKPNAFRIFYCWVKQVAKRQQQTHEGIVVMVLYGDDEIEKWTLGK